MNTSTQLSAPDVRLLDEFSISLAKLKVVSTVLRAPEFVDGVDQDTLLGLEFLLEGIVEDLTDTFHSLEALERG